MKKTIVSPLVMVMLVALTMLACSSKYPDMTKRHPVCITKHKVSKDTVKARLEMGFHEHELQVQDSKRCSTARKPWVPVRFQLPASEFKGDIYEGIRMMSSVTGRFIVNADSLFTKTFRQPAASFN